MSGASGKTVIIEMAKELLSRLPVQHTDPSPPQWIFFSINAVQWDTIDFKCPACDTKLITKTTQIKDDWQIVSGGFAEELDT